MKTKWTEAQEKAITQKGSVLVSASAGTGKTAVLTERIVRLLIDGKTSIGNILVITFSHAAAKEMEERIKNKLSECITNSELKPSQRKAAYRQYKNFGLASIKTIHAFCKDVISKYYYKVGIASDFTVGDINTIGIMRKSIINEVLEEEYKDKDENFLKLVDYIDASENIEDVIDKTCEKLAGMINGEEWLLSAVEDYNITDFLPSKVKEMLISDFEQIISYYNKALKEVSFVEDKKAQKIRNGLNCEIITCNNIIKKLKENKQNAITESDLDALATRIVFPNDEDYAYARFLRDKGKDIINKYKKNNITTETQIERIKSMYPMAKYFAELCIKISKAFAEEKHNAKVIDFNDMEKFAYKILEDSSVANVYKNEFSKIFVDEYQDTNPIQESIIEKISRDNNLFCVGDLKQSIYRFRASDPTLFLSRNNAYKSGSKYGTVISLSNNFRSAQNILNCANDVFRTVAPNSKEISYDKEEELIHDRDDDKQENPVNLSLINVNNIKAEFPDLSIDEAEIYNVIATIKNIVGKEIYDPKLGENRPANYSDICILCRKLSGLSDLFYRLFSDNDIPFSIEKSTELFKTVEVENLMGIIELAVNPHNDINLTSFMHMGLLGFSDDDIISIRKHNYTKSLYDNMCDISNNSSPLAEKCSLLLSFLENIRNKEKYSSISEIVDYVIMETNYTDFIAVMKNGKQRLLNLDLLKQYVFEYEKENEPTLYGFTQFINKLKANNPLITAEINSTTDTNRVLITTIHKSKGLEYPIVIMPFVGKGFNKNDKRSNIIMDAQSGIGFRFFDEKKRLKGKTLIREFVAQNQSEKNIEEELRLLYVSMTRAKELLYIQGTISGASSFDSEAKNSLDWLKFTIFPNDIAGKFGLIKTASGLWQVNKENIEAIKEMVDIKASPGNIEDLKDKYFISEVTEKETVLKEERNTKEYIFELPELY